MSIDYLIIVTILAVVLALWAMALTAFRPASSDESALYNVLAKSTYGAAPLLAVAAIVICALKSE